MLAHSKVAHAAPVSAHLRALLKKPLFIPDPTHYDKADLRLAISPVEYRSHPRRARLDERVLGLYAVYSLTELLVEVT